MKGLKENKETTQSIEINTTLAILKAFKALVNQRDSLRKRSENFKDKIFLKISGYPKKY